MIFEESGPDISIVYYKQILIMRNFVDYLRINIKHFRSQSKFKI